MKLYARVLSLVFSLCLLMAFHVDVEAAETNGNTGLEAAQELYNYGLFKGVGTDSNGSPIFELEKMPSRNQAVIMLVRLLGKESVAKSGNWNIPFTDVTDSMKPYVGFAYANALTSGKTPTTFGGTQNITENQYITFILRALGYSSGSDFKVSTAGDFASSIGLTGARQQNTNSVFTRSDVAVISRNALYCKLNTSDRTLLDQLRNEGAIKADHTAIQDSEPTVFALNTDHIYISAGEQVTLIPNITSKEITWTSSDAKYFAVNNGVVSVVERGGADAIITATTSDGKSASCRVMMKSSEPLTVGGSNGKVYAKFPPILSMDNVFPEIYPWISYDSDLQEFDIYKYSYTYLTSSIEQAESAAEGYARWLRSKGYTLIFEGDDPITGGGNIAKNIKYELTDPSGVYGISIKGFFDYFSSSYPTYTVDVTIDYAKQAKNTATNPNTGVKIESIYLQDKNINKVQGTVFKTGAICMPANASGTVNWISSNPSVVSVRDLGSKTDPVSGYLLSMVELTMNSSGTATISVVASSGITAQCSVVVSGNDIAMAQEAVNTLKSILKNPSSLILNSVRSYHGSYGTVIEIDYSAMNGFGGYNREYFIYTGDTSGTQSTSVIDTHNYPYAVIDIRSLIV